MCEFVCLIKPLITKGIFVAATLLLAAILGHPATVYLLKMSGHKTCDQSGKWIGFVERSLVAFFVLLGFTAQTTFIFATKTAVMGFRIPRDDHNKQKKSAEYMLIGTMASFIFALLIGYLGKEIWGLLRR